YRVRTVYHSGVSIQLLIEHSWSFSTGSTLRITGWQWSAAELPVRVDAVVMCLGYTYHLSLLI
ncbi:MAG: hypothetical protein JW725_03155, partial [Candidatus Babeliaceae bacterium]|nr:hypothetical protein [Candidatus Babeliaceae bacterium]